MNALLSGKYDLDRTAVTITQTGGGCRATNYIALIRRALKSAGMAHIPVISVSTGLEKNPGFKLTLPMIKTLANALLYGDLLMRCIYKVRPYELNAGETNALYGKWRRLLLDEFVKADVPVKKYCAQIVSERSEERRVGKECRL